LLLLSLGLFMKVVLADALLADTADAVFNSPDALSSLDAWAGVFAFSGQIFLDFAGYSTCAIGVALCLGFVLPQNFNYPYAAIGFSDFWKRWHITLSAWLRDYLYIPLGGNKNERLRMYMALMLTMLLGGLWHGANWTFAAWGGLHGLYLWAEKFINDRRKISKEEKERQNRNWIGLLYAFLTFMLVNITWVFFRSESFSRAWQIFESMFGMATDGKVLLTTVAIVKVAIIIPAILIFHWVLRNRKIIDVAYRMNWFSLGLVWSFLILMLVWAQESGSAFIYFQF
jgi:alginate O-acetyltransferase complex protein AlgI